MSDADIKYSDLELLNNEDKEAHIEFVSKLHDSFYLVPVRFKPVHDRKAPVCSITTWKDKKIPIEKFNTGRVGIQGGYDGLEILDIDNKFGDAEYYFKLIKDHCKVDHMPHIATQSGGFHIYYKCEVIEGARKLAQRYSGQTTKNGLPIPWAIIETRGEGGYVVSPPTQGYTLINGDLFNVPIISIEEREFIWEVCRSQNEFVTASSVKGISRNTSINYEGDEPAGSKFNNDSSSISTICQLLRSSGWKSTDDINWTRPGKDKGVSATLGKAIARGTGNKLFHIFSSNTTFQDENYTLFGVYTELAHNGDYKNAARELGKIYNVYRSPSQKSNVGQSGKSNVGSPEKSNQNTDTPIDTSDVDKFEDLAGLKAMIRVGTDYYKIIKNDNKIVLKSWNRQAIIDDYGKDALKHIKRKYDDFENFPSHTDYKQTIGNNYNLYEAPCIYPAKEKGEFKIIDKFLEHIFGDQKDLGLDWIQIGYRNPLQRLPVLCLVGRDNNTGKSTFGHLMRAIYGQNYISIGQDEYSSEFNSSYATKNIVNIEEGEMDVKQIAKLKRESTDPVIQYRRMRADRVGVRAFMKFILQSNEKATFIKANKNDQRFWIRTIHSFEKFDSNFLEKMESELPFFLNYIMNRQLFVKESEGRFWIGHERYLGSEFQDIVRNSRNKEINDLFESMFDDLENKQELILRGSTVRIKEWYAPMSRSLNTTMIANAFETEMDLKSKYGRYVRYDSDHGITKDLRGTYFEISKERLKMVLGYEHEDLAINDFEYHEDRVFDSVVVPIQREMPF